MNIEPMPRTQSHDSSGFGVFSHGHAGQAHVIAHGLLDQARHGLGHRLLGAWLEQHEGNGSDWIHLQWHMAIFEIAVGRWEDALMRFQTHILPVATRTQDALTDAPALLWRLQLTATKPVSLEWGPVRDTAKNRLRWPSSPYVELHCLLALAGAGDVAGLDHWLRSRSASHDLSNDLLTQMGVGLRAFAVSEHELAAVVLGAAVPKVAELGGSRAQNQLFAHLAQHSWRCAETVTRAAA
jgi:hypothetical protein